MCVCHLLFHGIGGITYSTNDPLTTNLLTLLVQMRQSILSTRQMGWNNYSEYTLYTHTPTTLSTTHLTTLAITIAPSTLSTTLSTSTFHHLRLLLSTPTLRQSLKKLVKTVSE